MALYEVVLNTRFAGQLCVNRWNYTTVTAFADPTGSTSLLQAMGLAPSGSPATFPADGLLALLQAILSTGLEFVSVSARQIYNVEDFYEFVYPSDTNGDVTGESMSPVIAFGYRTSRVRTDIRRATKRFAGVPESSIGTEGMISAGVLAAVKEVADKMSENLVITPAGTTYTFYPIVVQKEKYTTPSGKDAYRYYADEEEQYEHIAEGIVWTEYESVRSQTSRQYGRGS